ncbi:MAG: hypothetical protein PHO66_01810 [Eubacteriales bacterium]|nr:hypothetical protein [Eubacteriales bacterium]
MAIKPVWAVYQDSMARMVLSARFWLSVVLAMTVAGIVSGRFIDYAAAQSQPFNIIEAYLSLYCIFPIGPIFFLVITTFLFCDAPFFSVGQAEVLYRTGRARWLAGKVLYIVTCALIIQAAMLLSVVLRDFAWGYWGHVWSTVMYGGSTTNTEAFACIYTHTMHATTPYGALGAIAALNALLGVAAGLLLFLLNLRFKRIFGYLAILAAILLAVFCYSGLVPATLSPIHAGMLSAFVFQTPTRGYYFRFLPIIGAVLGACAALGALCFLRLKTVSFTYGQ